MGNGLAVLFGQMVPVLMRRSPWFVASVLLGFLGSIPLLFLLLSPSLADSNLSTYRGTLSTYGKDEQGRLEIYLAEQPQGFKIPSMNLFDMERFAAEAHAGTPLTITVAISAKNLTGNLSAVAVSSPGASYLSLAATRAAIDQSKSIYAGVSAALWSMTGFTYFLGKRHYQQRRRRGLIQ